MAEIGKKTKRILEILTEKIKFKIKSKIKNTPSKPQR